ncbi:MAG: hypothetical protein KF854_03305 [Nitrospira sp.]|nr:hypothetical protein [Nitrospira sp.]HNL15168.1 hypothetical protein [Accumulibacter sp.]HMZ56207.1 hypothetical protein [Nitrospira sp.]HNA27945.1 hypothetical protein [Nitrospira sp.]HNI68095.1 hypothetical protein [Nitrospira sp.]
MKRVIVNIDRLVLKGFRFEDRHAIAQGLQEQLARLLADPGMAERIGTVGNLSRLRVAPIQVAPESKPHEVGTTAANGIRQGLTR